MIQQFHSWVFIWKNENICTSVSTAALLTIAKVQKQPVSNNRQMDKEDVAAAAAKSLQSCPTLYDPIDGSPWDSPIPGILQARTMAWVAISFSSAWKWTLKVKSLSRVRLLATPTFI